jgi:lysophospholipase L1-like esterase
VKAIALSLAATLAAALVLGELMLRAIGFSHPTWYQPHPELGWTLRPGAAAWFTGEGRAWVEINDQGRRDAGATRDKPNGVYRIAVLGDSYSEAMQVARDETYWAQLPQYLRACGFAGDRKVEVLNFGVSGYGTGQQYLVLESSALGYRPDLVLLQFTNGNDVKDNSALLDEEQGRAYFRLEGGQLRADLSRAAAAYERRMRPSVRLGRALSDHSRLAQLARLQRQALLTPAAHADEPTGIEQGLEPLLLAPPADPRWEEAWQITEALVLRIAESVARSGARFLVMNVPYAVQVYPDPQVRAALQARLGVEDLFYPDRRIGALAARAGFQAVAMAPHMQRLAEESGVYFHGFDNVGMGRGHWNAQGHRAAAERLARHLCPEGRHTPGVQS